MPYLKMRWEKHENQRYYEVLVDHDLFGCVVTRIWGSKGTSLGRIVHRPCCDFEEGKSQMMVINKQRQQRGYVLVTQEGQGYD